MRKLFVAVLATSFSISPLRGETSPAPVKPSPTPRAVTPAAAPARPVQPQKRLTFFQRLFGVRPTPTPVPAPAPVVKHRLRPKTRPATEVPPTVATVPVPATPGPGPRPKTVKSNSKKGAATAAISTGADDVTKFKAAKTKAQEDGHIKDLKSKADSEVNEAEAHKALLNYNRALFQKIREVDPSVSGYSGKVEQSMTRRLGTEKGNE